MYWIWLIWNWAFHRRRKLIELRQKAFYCNSQSNRQILYIISVSIIFARKTDPCLRLRIYFFYLISMMIITVSILCLCLYHTSHWTHQWSNIVWLKVASYYKILVTVRFLHWSVNVSYTDRDFLHKSHGWLHMIGSQKNRNINSSDWLHRTTAHVDMSVSTTAPDWHVFTLQHLPIPLQFVQTGDVPGAILHVIGCRALNLYRKYIWYEYNSLHATWF